MSVLTAAGIAGSAVLLAQPSEVAVAEVASSRQAVCDDFGTSAQAQAALARGETQLDRDKDGVACESKFGDTVQVKPNADPDLEEKFTPGRSVSVPK